MRKLQKCKVAQAAGTKLDDGSDDDDDDDDGGGDDDDGRLAASAAMTTLYGYCIRDIAAE